MNFGKALKLLKKGRKLRRREWERRDMFIYMPTSENDHPLCSKYLSIGNAGGGGHDNKDYRVKMEYLASHNDLFANDWEIFLG